MATRIRFRLNKITGQVEEFLVDDQDRSLPEAEHDRIASEVGSVIARHPRISEVLTKPLPAADAPLRDQAAPDAQEDRTPGQEEPIRDS